MADHSIYAMSYEARPNWIACKCGEFVDAIPGIVTIDRAWAIHCGKEYVPGVAKYEDLATDEEVGDFLNKIANPWWKPAALIPRVVHPAYRETAEERAMGALEEIAEIGTRCTCNGTISRDCPNFVEGDDEY